MEENKRKIKNYINKTGILNACFILFCISLLSRFFHQIFHTYDCHSWTISEFLINYQGGFVRRGLLGDILFHLSKFCNLEIEWMIKFICLLCVCFILFFFVKFFLKRGFPLYLLPLCFFLGELFAQYYWNILWIRKDVIMISFLIIILFIASKKNLLFQWKILLINVLAVTVILMHEGFVFFSLPILSLIIFRQLNSGCSIVKSLILTMLSILPIASAFLFVSFYHGDLDTAKAIWHSYPFMGEFPEIDVLAGNDFSEEQNAITAIGWTVIKNLKMCVLHNFLWTDDGIISIIGWSVIFPVVYYLITNTLFVFRKDSASFTEKHKTVLSALLLFQFVSLLPLWLLLFCDYLRLFFFLSASTFAVFLIFDFNYLETIFPEFILNKVNRFNQLLPKPNKAVIAVLMFVIGISPEFYNHRFAFETSMLYHVLSLVSKPFIALINLLLT